MTDENSAMTDENSAEGGVETAEFVLTVQEHLNQYIELADRKASILLSALIAYLGISFGVISSTWIGSGLIYKIASVVTVGTALFAVTFAAGAVYPNTPKTPQGLILWDSIADWTREQYMDEIFSKSEEDLLEELIDENYQLAEVNVKKYSRVKYAILCTGITVFFGLLTISVFIINSN